MSSVLKRKNYYSARLAAPTIASRIPIYIPPSTLNPTAPLGSVVLSVGSGRGAVKLEVIITILAVESVAFAVGVRILAVSLGNVTEGSTLCVSLVRGLVAVMLGVTIPEPVAVLVAVTLADAPLEATVVFVSVARIVTTLITRVEKGTYVY